MEEHQIQKIIDESSLSNKNYTDKAIQKHTHNGTTSHRISSYDLDNFIDISLNIKSEFIPISGQVDTYFLAPSSFLSAEIRQINFSGLEALATSDTNYITFTFTNLGQNGTGTAAILGTETTKTTGGTAIAANTKKTFTLASNLDNLLIKTGDRVKIRAAVTGTLPNVVQYPVYLIAFKILI